MATILSVRRDAEQGTSEWLLSACFQLLSRAMQAAAHFCGIAQQRVLVPSVASLLGAESLGAPDLPALFFSDLPLSEIAAAERERMTRQDCTADVLSAGLTSGPAARRVLH